MVHQLHQCIGVHQLHQCIGVVSAYDTAGVNHIGRWLIKRETLNDFERGLGQKWRQKQMVGDRRRLIEDSEVAELCQHRSQTVDNNV